MFRLSFLFFDVVLSRVMEVEFFPVEFFMVEFFAVVL